MLPEFIKQNFLRIGIVLSLIFGITFGWAYFTFQVKNISIVRTENTVNVRSGSIAQILEYVKGANIFLLKVDSLENHFVKTFKEVESISIKKIYPNTLKVEVNPLPIIAKWEYSFEEKNKKNIINDQEEEETKKAEGENNNIIKKLGYLNKNNLFLEHNTSANSENLITIIDKQSRKSEIQFYDIVPDGHYIPDIISAKKKLEKITERKISEINYYRDAQEIYFVDEKGVAYWLYLEEDLFNQIEKLEYMLDEKNILKWRLDYIDLRINGKVIYKFDE